MTLVQNQAAKDNYDFIGDIHGHADELVNLLHLLGYSIQDGSYAHPSRKAFFVGDYIDRGPLIRETLQIVKAMVDSNNAVALMGNHEYNALCFHYEHTTGGHLRKHTITNVMQHYRTLQQFQNRQDEYEMYLQWFKTLPLFYETANFRAVHACWDNEHIQFLRTVLDNGRLTDELIHGSVVNNSRLHEAVEETLKGKEMQLPTGVDFKDKDGTVRSEFRIRWWEDPMLSSYRSIGIEPMDFLPETSIDTPLLKNSRFYSTEDRPVFFGHYWLKGTPAPYKHNVCCLDYSVAKQGDLVCYRFDGERSLEEGKLVLV